MAQQSNPIKGSQARQAINRQIEEGGDHRGAAMIAAALIGVGEGIQRSGRMIASAIDRATDESARQWGYNKPPIR